MLENQKVEFELSPTYEEMPPVNTAKPNLGQLELCLFFVVDEIM